MDSYTDVAFPARQLPPFPTHDLKRQKGAVDHKRGRIHNTKWDRPENITKASVTTVFLSALAWACNELLFALYPTWGGVTQKGSGRDGGGKSRQVGHKSIQTTHTRPHPFQFIHLAHKARCIRSQRNPYTARNAFASSYILIHPTN